MPPVIPPAYGFFCGQGAPPPVCPPAYGILGMPESLRLFLGYFSLFKGYEAYGFFWGIFRYLRVMKPTGFFWGIFSLFKGY